MARADRPGAGARAGPRRAAPSTYEATLAFNFGDGYPFGGFVPLGVVRRALGRDAAWAVPALHGVAGRAAGAGAVGARRRRWSVASPARSVVAFVAAQAGAALRLLPLGRDQGGGGGDARGRGVRPGGGRRAAARAATRLLAPIACRRPRSSRSLSAGGAGLARAGRGRGCCLSRLATAARRLAAVAVGRRRGGGARRGRSSPGRQLGLGRGSYSTRTTSATSAGRWIRSRRGHLARRRLPLRSSRGDADGPRATAIAGGSRCGLRHRRVVARRGRWRSLPSASARSSCRSDLLVGSPWLDGKALAIASPAAAVRWPCSASRLPQRGAASRRGWRSRPSRSRRSRGHALAQWGDVSLAPRDQLEELEEIGERDRGRGPDADDRVPPYGARLLPARRRSRESVSELRRRPIPLADGGEVDKGHSADTDLLDPDALAVYRTLVLRRSPAQSRPPSPYRLVWRGEYYEAWQRPADAAALRAARRSALGPTRSPGHAARRADARARRAVAAAPRGRADPLPPGEHPADGARAFDTSSRTGRLDRGGGRRRARRRVRGVARRVGPLGGRAIVDGEAVRRGAARTQQLRPVRQLRRVAAHGGRRTGSSCGSAAPASIPAAAARRSRSGPIALSRGEAADSTARSGCRLGRPRALCGRAWDWIEASATRRSAARPTRSSAAGAAAGPTAPSAAPAAGRGPGSARG